MKTFIEIVKKALIYTGCYILAWVVWTTEVLFMGFRAIRLGILRLARSAFKELNPNRHIYKAWNNMMRAATSEELKYASNIYELGFYKKGKRS